MNMISFVQEYETLTAQLWAEISTETFMTEGLCFDRSGENLYFVNVYEGKILCLNMVQKLCRIVYESAGEKFGAVKIDRAGRLFVCSLGDLKSGGGIFAIDQDGNNREEIVPAAYNYMVDDLAFDREGNIYFTDLKGDVCNPCGGVYRVSAVDGEISQVMKGLASPNGIAFSEDYTGIWVTEMNANRLLYGRFDESRSKVETSVAAHLNGRNGPDSCCVDEKGNVYIAMYGQGRIVVVRKNGVPVGQIVFPQTEKGNVMNTATVALIPGTCEVVIGATDMTEGSVGLYRASALAGPAQTFQFLPN